MTTFAGFGSSEEVAAPQRAQVGCAGQTAAALRTKAEIGGDDRHLAAAVNARGVGGMHGTEANLAPAAVEQVRPVLRAVHPEVQRTAGVDVRRRPEDVLAGGPPAVAAVAVE